MNLVALKTLNESKLLSEGIEVNPNLPTIEALSDVSPQLAANVASRVCAMSYIVGLAFNVDPKLLVENLKKYSLWNFVSEWEKNSYYKTNYLKRKLMK